MAASTPDSRLNVMLSMSAMLNEAASACPADETNIFDKSSEKVIRVPAVTGSLAVS